MAYMYVHGFCINCGTSISFNAHRVPSIRVNGCREPLCAGCHDKWNEMHRTSKGLDPVSIHPNAYEPVEV